MVANDSPSGLIATTGVVATPPLDELVACSAWPLVLEASPRRLQRRLALHMPDCVLFWLDDWLEIAGTARLITWLRQRGSRPYRLAVAHQMEGDVESVLRAAGAHGFLTMVGRSEHFVDGALRPLLQDARCLPAVRAAKAEPLFPSAHHLAAAESAQDLARPP